MYVAAMHNYAPRWGQSTDFGIIMRRATEPGSRKPIFARKNDDFIITSILHESEALPKCTRRWGQSTIFWLFSENLIFCIEKHRFCSGKHFTRKRRYTEICTALRPEHNFKNSSAPSCDLMLPKPYFYKEKRWSCTRPKSRLLLASRWTPGRPEASAAEFLRFGPTKAPRAWSKNLNWGFHVLRYYDGSSHDTKICTALRPEDDFRNDALKPEKVMLPKAYFLQGKLKI